ncbi:acyl-CoA/acyl-ACP dehydrogenase [Pseudomonas fluorescens]|nr:acyl-CoA/acyl-ACP dehydrogenase [Pseudomonas fluorescens]
MIDLIPDEDQQALLDSVSSFLRNHVDVGKTRTEDLWEQIAALGWLGLSRSEEAGGAGFGSAGEMLLLRECGRFLVTPSLAATLLAIRLADQSSQTDLADELAEGKQRAALAIQRDAESFYVIDGSQADLVVLIGDEKVTLHRALEPGRLLHASDDLVGLSQTNLVKALDGSLNSTHAYLLVAAQLTGIAEAVRDLATDYAKVREQFGQPIGAFQAVKHACADLAIRAEAALAQTGYAALCLGEDTVDTRTSIAAALRVAGDAAITGAESSIQLHGAMGFTEECTAHLYLKRAQLLSLFAGHASWQIKVLVEQA